MNELVTLLAHYRAELDAHKAELKERQAELDEILAALPIAQTMATIKEEVDVLAAEEQRIYRALCIEAVNAYETTHDKRPHPAVQIKLMTQVDYNEDKFKAWAIEHDLPGLLKLDKAAAKKVATGPTAPDFVTIGTYPQATVATDLSEYLDEQ